MWVRQILWGYPLAGLLGWLIAVWWFPGTALDREPSPESGGSPGAERDARPGEAVGTLGVPTRGESVGAMGVPPQTVSRGAGSTTAEGTRPPPSLKPVVAHLDAGRLAAAATALQRYQDKAPYDAQARWLEARLQLARKRPEAALETLLTLLEAFPSTQVPPEAREKARQLARRVVEQRRGENPHDATWVPLLQRLTQIWPQHAGFHFFLAEAFLVRGQHASAEAHLAYTRQEPGWARQAERLTEQLEQRRERLTTAARSIPLQRIDEQLLIEAQLGEGPLIRFMIDTGASVTVVTPEAVRRSGIREGNIQPVRLRTAGGLVTASRLASTSLRLGPVTVRNIAPVRHDLTLPGAAQGLLGMDVLSRFAFTIDRESDRLQLAPKPDS